MIRFLDMILKEWEGKRAIEPDEALPIRNILTTNKTHLIKVPLKQNLQVFLMKTPSLAQIQYNPNDKQEDDQDQDDDQEVKIQIYTII